MGNRLVEGIYIDRLVFGRLREEAIGSLKLKRELKYQYEVFVGRSGDRRSCRTTLLAGLELLVDRQE